MRERLRSVEGHLRGAWRALVPYPLRGAVRTPQGWLEQRTFLHRLSASPRQAPRGSDELRRALRARAGQRRMLRGRPRVIAFGARQWESLGLWPAFERLSDFTLVDYAEVLAAIPEKRAGTVQRRQIIEYCKQRIGSAGERFDLAFLYIDTEYLEPDLFRHLRGLGTWTVLMGLDDKRRLWLQEERGMPVGQETVAADVDLLWSTFRAGCAYVESRGGRAWYAPEAADPGYHRPMGVPRTRDIVFVGQRNFGRWMIVEGLRRCGFRVEAFGQGWGNGFISSQRTVELFSEAKVVLGVGDAGGIAGAQHLKGRDFEVPMCGAVYLTTYNPELADWFDIGREILCYSSLPNLVEVLTWILPNESAQDEIRASALARARRDHTWEVRLRQMFSLFQDPEGGSA